MHPHRHHEKQDGDGQQREWPYQHNRNQSSRGDGRQSISNHPWQSYHDDHRQIYQAQPLPLPQPNHMNHPTQPNEPKHHHPKHIQDLEAYMHGLKDNEKRTLAYRSHHSKASSRSLTKSASSRIHKAMSVERFLNPVVEPAYASPSSSSSGSARSPKPKGTKKQAGNSPAKSRKGSTGARPPYTTEEGLYIWYLRTDLGLAWDQVEVWFGRWFGKCKREKGGLQCKFYRVIESWGVERVRTQHRSLLAKDNPKHHENWTAAFGLTYRSDLVFEWMRPEHQYRPLLTGAAARLKAPYPENPRQKDKPRTKRKSSVRKDSRL